MITYSRRLSSKWPKSLTSPSARAEARRCRTAEAYGNFGLRQVIVPVESSSRIPLAAAAPVIPPPMIRYWLRDMMNLQTWMLFQSTNSSTNIQYWLWYDFCYNSRLVIFIRPQSGTFDLFIPSYPSITLCHRFGRYRIIVSGFFNLHHVSLHRHARRSRGVDRPGVAEGRSGRNALGLVAG